MYWPCGLLFLHLTAAGARRTMISVIRVAYHTLGCKVNQYETEKIREALERAGFETAPFGSRADAYIINTCSVTSVADGKSRAAVRRALRANPEAFVVVAGCYAELEPDAFRAIEGVDLVVPNAEKDGIAERVVARFARSGEWRVESGERPEGGKWKVESGKPGRPRLRTRAIVKVQDGCDQFCSYCIVPHARKVKTSRPIGDVLAEVRALAGFGYREIVLTGIRLGSYGSGEWRVESGEPEGSGGWRAESGELEGSGGWRAESGEREGKGLADLVGAVVEIEGVERVRLSSVEPWEVDGALLEAMGSPKVCRHLAYSAAERR